MSLKITPLYDRVMIKRTQADEKTAGGILLPQTGQEKPVTGEVLAVGPGTRDQSGHLHPLSVKSGDKVVFAKWSGTEYKHQDTEVIFIKESDILGIIQK